MASTLMSSTDIRNDLIGVDLNTAGFERIIDAADLLIRQRFGPHSGAHTVKGEGCFVYLQPQADTAATITVNDGAGNEIDADMYSVSPAGTSITLGYWEDEFTVTYTISADVQIERRPVLIDLVRLAANYDAVRRSAQPGFSSESYDYFHERNEILKRLAGVRGYAVY